MLRSTAEFLIAAIGMVVASVLQHQYRAIADPQAFLVAAYGVPAAAGFLLGRRGVVAVTFGAVAACMLLWNVSDLAFVLPAVLEAVVGRHFGRSMRSRREAATTEDYALLLILCGTAAFVRTLTAVPLLGLSGSPAWDECFSCLFPALLANTTLLPLLFVFSRRDHPRNLTAKRGLEFGLYLIVAAAAMWAIGDTKLRQTISQAVPLIAVVVAMMVLTILRFEVLGIAAMILGCHTTFGLRLLIDPPTPSQESSLIVAAGFFAAVNIASILLAANIAERRRALRQLQSLLLEVQRQRDELQRLADDAVRRQAILETALDQLPAGFLVVDSEDRVQHMNAVSRDWFTGLSVAMGRPLHETADWTNYLPDGQIEPFSDCAIHVAARTGRTTREHDIVFVPNHFPERRRELTLTAAPVRDAAGVIHGAVVLMQDLSEQKRTARRLQESEERLRLVLKLTRLQLWEYDYESQATVSSEPIGVWHGLPAELGITSLPELMAHIHPDDLPRLVGIRDRVKQGMERSFELTYRIVQPDGSTKLFLTRGYVLPPETTSGMRSSGVTIDISKQRADEQRLRLLESAVVHARDAVIVLEAQPSDALGRKVLYVNRAFTELSGYETAEIIGRSLHPLRGPESDPATLEQLRTALEAGTPLKTELMNYAKDGRKYWVELSLVPVPDGEGGQVSWVMIQRDISERKHAAEVLRARDEQLFQSQKMETVGQLAGGVAHDFNNLLTAVIGNLCLVELPPDDPNRELLAVAEQAAQRAADLTKKLLGFARRNQILVRSVPVRDFVLEVVGLLRRTIDPRIEIHAEIPEGINCLADTTLLNQVLLNLCLNSRDAMTGGGSLTIHACDEPIDVVPADAPTDLKPGLYVKISVSDTGHGMTPETVARLYEPFFTTKPLGQGTGLGLAMVHGIIRQHNGWIVCRSSENGGTTFEFRIPTGDGTQAVPKSVLLSRMHNDGAQRRAAAVRRPAKRSELILLVDDEEMIRDIAKAVLEAAGFRVLQACDGLEAVAIYGKHKDDIRLVVLDMIMPKLSGRDAAERIIALNANARILLSSGYTTDDITEVAGVHAVLSKPYRPNELLAAVLDALVPEATHEPQTAVGSPPTYDIAAEAAGTRFR